MLDHTKLNLVLEGPEAVGKTLLAKMIAAGRKSFTIDGRKLSGRFPFQAVPLDTEVLIIDDLPEKCVRDWCYQLFNGLLVERKGLDRIWISPQVIITCRDIEHRSDLRGASFDARFKIIFVDYRLPF